jgi:hypothetical protein
LRGSYGDDGNCPVDDNDNDGDGFHGIDGDNEIGDDDNHDNELV